MKIDPQRSFAKVDEALDRIMATQIDQPRYPIYGQGVGDTGPKGQQEVQAF